MFGFHMQQTVNNWLDAVAQLPPYTPVKAVDHGDMLVQAKAANPGVFTILRHWYDPGQVFGGTYEENKSRARTFFQTFVDNTFRTQYAPHIDAVEEFNEYWDSRHVPLEQREWLYQTYGIGYTPEFLEQEYQDRLRWVQAVNDVWTTEYRTQPELAHIRLITGNVPIGNDIPLAYAQVVQEHGGLLSYHPYILTVNGTVEPTDDLYHSGRWKWNDHYFRINDVFVQWIGTEGGPYTGVLTGWRHPDVCNANVACYLAALVHFGERASAWNALHNNRFRGKVLFTTDSLDGTWKWYHVQQPEMNSIAQTSEQYPLGEPGEPPPPPVPGENLLPNGSFEGGWYHLNGVPELQMANQWTGYWHEGVLIIDGEEVNFVRPEFRVLPKEQLPPDEQDLFVLDGNYTIKVFKGFGPILWRYSSDAFLLPAGTYKFVINFYPDLVMAYENGQKIFADDPLAGEYRVVINGENVSDYISPFPFGQWYTVETEFESDGETPTTVGVRFRSRFGLRNNGWFMDAWRVELVAPPPPPPGECRGEPRVQYERVYWVLHPSVSNTSARNIFAAALPERRTVGFSFDDAGIGDLDVRRVVAWGVPANEQQEFIDWYAEHYPGVELSFRDPLQLQANAESSE